MTGETGEDCVSKAIYDEVYQDRNRWRKRASFYKHTVAYLEGELTKIKQDHAKLQIEARKIGALWGHDHRR